MENEDYSNLTLGLLDGTEIENQLRNIISNPIHIYDIIKQMLWFIDQNNRDVKLLLTLPSSGVYLYFPQHSFLGYFRHSKTFLELHCTGKQNSILSIVKRHMNEGMAIPIKNDLSAATFSLWILPLVYRVHPIELVDGKVGGRQTNIRLDFEDIIHVAEECFHSSKSLFLDTRRSYFVNAKSNDFNYAVAIEWTEAAEL